MLGLQWDEKVAQGGLLVKLLTQKEATAATVAGVGARNAATATEGQSLLGQIGSWLARWLGFETSKTGATVTGAATRTAAQIAAAEASRAFEVAAGMVSIQISASEAAAAAFADSAMEGPPGLIAAPGVAAATYAAVLGWGAGLGGAIAFAAGGMELERDQLVFAHRREMILPADITTGLKGIIATGSSGSSSTGATAGRTSITVGDLYASIYMPPGGRMTGDELVSMLWDAWRNGNATLRSMLPAN